MCGIGLCIDCELDEKSIELLKRRGPDSYQTIQRTYSHCLTFYSSVLSQQGSGVESQPIETENTLLLFNGEIYWHPKFSTQGTECDSLWLGKEIERLGWDIDDILELLSEIRGEFTFILFNKCNNEIILGRDRLGRRSLLISASSESLCLVSVGANSNLIELPADGIYHINLNSGWSQMKRYNYPAVTEVENHYNKELIFINNLHESEISPLDVEKVLSNASEFIITIDSIPYSKTLPEHWNFNQNVSKLPLDEAVNGYEEIAVVDELLNAAVSRRIKFRKGKIGILFSGGLDCSLVTYYAAMNATIAEIIYLFSVAFGKEDKDFAACPRVENNH